MPKEVVYNSQQFSPDPSITSLTEVRWSREGSHVQLATVVVDTCSHDPIEMKVSGGWYIDLDRKSINDLIRYLRRARDQAFGKDE